MPMTAASSVGRALRHWHWLIWLAVLLAAGLAVAAAFVRPPAYEASTLLSIDESQSSTQGFDVAMQADQFLAQRFISLGTSRDVLQAVCAREGSGCDPTALGRQVRVTTPRATAQLEIVADASSPQVAARLANETADALIASNRAQVNGQLQQQRAYLQGQLDQVGGQIAQTLQRASAAEAAGRSDAAGLAQLSFLQTQYSATYQRLQDLDLQASQRRDVLTVQQRAVPPRTPVDPDPVRYVLVGVAGGLVAGLLMALLAERLRKRICHASELAEAAGTDLVLDVSRGSSAAPYGFLARLGRAGPARRPRGLMLVASSERDRVNEVAMHIAQAVAASDERALVVPAPEPVATEGDGPEAARSRALLVAPEGSRIHPVSSGHPEEGIALALHCWLPPAQDPAVRRLGSAPDRAILVATTERTRFSDARRTAGLLRALGVEVVAAVLLPARMRGASLPADTRPGRSRATVTGAAAR